MIFRERPVQSRAKWEFATEEEDVKRTHLRMICGAAVMLFGAGMVSMAASSGYHLLNTYKFDAAPGAKTEYFDYVTVDSDAGRVYLGRGSAVQVINASDGKSLGFIEGFQR